MGGGGGGVGWAALRAGRRCGGGDVVVRSREMVGGGAGVGLGE